MGNRSAWWRRSPLRRRANAGQHEKPSRARVGGWLALLLLAATRCGGPPDCNFPVEMVIKSGDAPLLPDGGHDCSACGASAILEVYDCNPVTVESQPAVACLERNLCLRGPPPGSEF
jgi:hypothetical protein